MANQWAEKQLTPIADLWELQNLTNILWPIEISREIDKKLAKNKKGTTESLLIWLSDTGDLSLTNKELKQYLTKLFETISNKYTEFYNQKNRTSYAALSLAIVSSKELINCISVANKKISQNIVDNLRLQGHNYMTQKDEFKELFEAQVIKNIYPKFTDKDKWTEVTKLKDASRNNTSGFLCFPSLETFQEYR